jgi:hypothetical protein
MEHHQGAATASQVREILGPVDDEVVLRVVQTEASAAEVLEALTWISADDHLGQTLQRQPAGRVAAICDILSADQEEDPDA